MKLNKNLIMYRIIYYGHTHHGDGKTFVAYATGRNNTEVHRCYFIHSVNQVKLQYINKQSSMSDIIMNNTGIGIITIRMIMYSLFYAIIMQLTSIPAL